MYEHKLFGPIPQICKQCYLEPATITCPDPCAAFRQLETIKNQLDEILDDTGITPTLRLKEEIEAVIQDMEKLLEVEG